MTTARTCPAVYPIRCDGQWISCDQAAGHGPNHHGVDSAGANHHWHCDLRDSTYLAVAHYPTGVAQSLYELRRTRCL